MFGACESIGVCSLEKLDSLRQELSSNKLMKPMNNIVSARFVCIRIATRNNSLFYHFRAIVSGRPPLDCARDFQLE